MKDRNRSGKGYRVHYHLIQVIYFDRDRVFSSEEYANIWQKLSMFGDHKASAAFWRQDSSGPGKPSWTKLGSLDLLLPLLQDPPKAIFGGCKVSQRDVLRDHLLDCDLHLTLDNPWWEQRIRQDGYYNLAISEPWVEQSEPQEIIDLLRQTLETADRHCPYYGLVDLARPEDAHAGLVYSSSWELSMPISRWVENQSWLYNGCHKRDRARGIYWGNYFGQGILDRLGGREQFVAAYRAKSTMADGSIDAHIWEFPNGVFLSLCLDPLGCKPGLPMDILANSRLEWLHQRMGPSGALNMWDPGDPTWPRPTLSEA
jgi:hypothetical protein